ncbi:MAG: exosortase E/protease, VPEID-CTERM system [Isosphaeraceae bacterium]
MLRAGWATLVLLPLAELMALTVRFDTKSLVQTNGGWSELIARAPQSIRLVLVVVGAILLCGGSRLLGDLIRLIAQPDSARRRGLYVVAHLAALAGFTGLTALVMEHGVGDSAHGTGWIVAWLAAGLTSLILWGAALASPALWRPLFRRHAGALLAGAAVGLAAWAAGTVTGQWWRPLARLTFLLVQGFLSLVCREVVCHPAEFLIGTPAFTVEIAPACSGYEGIGLIWVFLGAYLWLFRRSLRFPGALWLLPLGTVLIWLANAARIAALILIGAWGSPAVAVGGFHSQAGGLAFNLVGLGLVALAHRSRFFAFVDADAENGPQTTNPTAAYLVPLLTIVATAMIGAACSSGFDWSYPLRVLAVGGVLWSFRRSYAGLKWTWSWPAVAIGTGVFLLWMVLEPVSASDDAPNTLTMGLAALPKGWAVVWVAFRVIGSVVTVPLAEELAFRGYLTRRLITADFQEAPLGRFSWWSFLASSILFGMLHGRWLAGTLAGMLYALALYRRRNLTDAVMAHATTNALIAVYVLATETWSLWL